MCGTNNSGVIIEYDDPSPAGISLSPGYYTYADPCPCVAAGKCPDCGEPLTGNLSDYGAESDLRCSHYDEPDSSPTACGWSWLNGCVRAQEPPDYEPAWGDY